MKINLKKILIWGLIVFSLNTSIYAKDIEILTKVMGTVIETTATYTQPNEESLEFVYLLEGETFEILEINNNFYGIKIKNLNDIIYINKEKMTVKDISVEIEKEIPIEKEMPIEKKLQPKAQTVLLKKTNLREEIVKFALEYVGKPYVYGGNDLNKGVDCSGFAQQVYKKFGVQLKRTSADQFYSNGKSITKKDLQKGDLIFYGEGSSISHVAIYIGDGKIVHAATPKDGICIDNAWSYMPTVRGYKSIF